MQSEIIINRADLLTNLHAIKHLAAPDAKLMAVVKSNAYGHGLVLISKICQSSKLVDYFGVVDIYEAIILRKSGIRLPILVLSYTSISEKLFVQAIKNKIELAMYDLPTAKILSKAAKKIKIKAKIHLKLETGLNRLGFSKSDMAIIRKISQLPYIEIAGVFSHFAAVEEKNYNYSRLQLSRFHHQIELLKKQKIISDECLFHIAASAAGFVIKDSRMSLVRSGISLYGLYPSEEVRMICDKADLKLKPVLSWKTKVLAVKKAKVGDYIGYGCTYKIAKPMKLAILAVGYADGYPRSLSNNGRVLIKGCLAPIVGRIAMNMAVIDVSKVKKSVKIGDEAILIGRMGKLEISVDDIAKWSNTINYEVVTRINWEIHRQVIS